MDSLSPKVIRSGFWSLGGNWFIRGLGLIKMIILARLLSPLDFGILGLATLSINILNVFSETGSEFALIQRDKIDKELLNTAWTMGLIRGMVLFFILFMGSGFFASFFDNLNLIPVLKVMASIFILGGLVNIGTVFFQRELDFKKKVSLDVVSDVAGTLITILLAFWLRNVWALVLGTIAWATTKCIASYCMHSYRPKLFWKLSIAKNLLNFGKHVFWIAIVTFIVTCGDDAIVGKLLGLAMLGFYTMAYNISNIPVSSLAGIIGRISFPAYSILQKEPARLAEAIKKLTELALIVLLPVTVLIILLSEDFILICLGDKWTPMIPVLKILSLLGCFRGLTNIFSPIHLAVNRPDIQSKNKTVELALFLLLIYPCTVNWGLIGTAWAVTTAYIASAIINAVSTVKIIPSFLQILLKASWVPVLSTLGMVTGVWLMHSWLEPIGGLIQFIMSGASGAVVFGLIVITARKDMLRNMLMSFREV